MDLFEYMRSTNMEKEAPLAARMRPRTLDEVVGQEHIIGKDKLLYRAIKADKISSIISMDRPVPAKRRWRKSLPILPVLNFNRLMPQWRAKRIWKKWWQRRRNCRECTGSVQFCSLTRSTVLIKDNRIICSRMWRTVRSFS